MISSLGELCIQVCVHYIDDVLLCRNESRLSNHGTDAGRGNEKTFDEFTLKEDVYLPTHLCEPILQEILKKPPPCLEISGKPPSCLLKVFYDVGKCQLKRLDLSHADLRDQSLLTGLLVHATEHLELADCMLKLETANKFKKLSNSLKVLNLSSTLSTWKKEGAKFLKHLKKLSRLDISYPVSAVGLDECLTTISKLELLERLDLSECLLKDITQLTGLASSLQQLFMYNVCDSLVDKSEISRVLSNLTSLTHLDISKGVVDPEVEESSEEYLDKEVLVTVSKLPNLVHFDMSGCRGLQIQDLDVFKESKLVFLGLFNTGLEFHQDIPAKMITGLWNEEQILNALEIYYRRASYMELSLVELSRFARSRDLSSPVRALQVLLPVAKAHLKSERLQKGISYCLSRLVRLVRPTNSVNVRLHKLMVPLLLDIMECQSSQIIQNRCCKSLSYCYIANEVGTEARRICRMMLRIIRSYTDDDLKQNAIIVFNEVIACSLVRNVYANEFGAINIMSGLIRRKIDSDEVDHIMAISWTVLWNITDETPENSELLIKSYVMEMFSKSLKNFGFDVDLLNNMMGLMGNIAEVKHLRHVFMKQEYIEKFIEFLSDKRNFEVGQNAAGILSHIMSDGEKAWTLTTISRPQCMESMISAMSRWDVKVKRQMNYRSLEPLLRLVPCSDAPAAQYWATWALTNLTSLNPEKYCELVVSEHGVEKLRALLASPSSIEAVNTLAETTIKTVTTYFGMA